VLCELCSEKRTAARPPADVVTDLQSARELEARERQQSRERVEPGRRQLEEAMSVQAAQATDGVRSFLEAAEGLPTKDYEVDYDEHVRTEGFLRRSVAERVPITVPAYVVFNKDTAAGIDYSDNHIVEVLITGHVIYSESRHDRRFVSSSFTGEAPLAGLTKFKRYSWGDESVYTFAPDGQLPFVACGANGTPSHRWVYSSGYLKEEDLPREASNITQTTEWFLRCLASFLMHHGR
jgi:hypothetical protein